jgi:hypothetical protein
MSDELEYISWQAPPAATTESERLGWLNSATEQGMAWLRSQRGTRDYRKAFDIISGQADQSTTTGDYRSRLNTNRLKRNIREIVGTMAKLRPMWGYHSDNKAYQSQAEMMNKTTRAWYLESFADRKIKEALQYAAATGRGWCHPIYRREMYGTGRGDITLLTYGAPCILPCQLPASGDWQSAYAVTILDEMPVAMAHGMFPLYQHRLRPTSSRYWYANDGVRKAASGNIITRMFGRAPRPVNGDPQLQDLLVPIRKTYIIDLTINRTKSAIPMGEPGASWSYIVPFVGQDIKVGVDPTSGTTLYRKADENDARLYPHRRLVISTDACIMYDGPGFDWHGLFPGISFTVDDWPWEPLGFSLVHDGWEIQDAINRIYRGNMDKTNAQLDPAMAYDTNAVSSAEAKRFDPLQPRARIGYDGQALEGQPMLPAVEAALLKIEPESLALAEKFESLLDAQQAISDVQALAKMRAVGSMDDLEKVIEANGPIIEDMSRAMEPPMRDLGVMIKYLILQYYTTTRIMQIVGADGVSREVFDYDPATIVPSHIPGENPDGPSDKSPRDRARIFADNLRFFIMPNSLHEMQQVSNKLGLLMLRKAGVMIDSQTIAEAFNVPAYGSLQGSTVMERWEDEQERQLLFAAKMKEIAGAVSGEATGLAPGAPKPNGSPGEGRPPSFTAPPTAVSKDGGTRAALKTSK